MEDKTPKLNDAKLTPDQRDKLEKWQHDVRQLQTLEDIATMAQEMLGIMDDQNKDTGRKTLIIDHVTGDDFVKILKNMQEAIMAFKEQKEPVLPDYSKPVVAAVSKLETALNSAIKGINLTPEVKVSAPNVKVAPPNVDLGGVEKALREMPKALDKAVKNIPQVEIPETDNTELLKAWEGISEQLVSIENATRAKPVPGSMKINNTSSNPVPISGSVTATIDPTGLATSTKQDTGNTSLGNIDTSTASFASAVKTEDATHTTGDKGIFTLAVRNDTGAVLAGNDLDYIPFTVDSTGALRTDLNGTVSTNNSSTATLTSGSVFTGTSDDCLNYNEIRISGIASHASATNGLSIQQSSDNSNWDITDTYTISAATAFTYAVPRQARYFRIVYTNGGTGQSSFRLQTILNRLGAQASSQRPSDGYTNETDLEQVQGFPMVYNGSTWDRTKSVATGVQAVGVNDGTNTASVVANDSGYNGQAMNHSTKTLGPVSTSGTGAQILFANTDVRGYASIRVVWSAVGSGLASTAQFANTSGGTYGNSAQFSQGASATSVPTTTGSTVAVRFIGPIIDNFFQLNVTALTSGTATAIVTLSTAPFVPPSTTVQGSKTNNATAPAASQIDVMPAIGNAAIPSYTEGFSLKQSMDLSGNTRVLQVAGTGTTTTVASSATNVTLFSANNAAKARSVFNESTQVLYIKFGATASATSYMTQVGANTLFEFPQPTYSGQVDGIWASANGNARCTEST